MPSSRRDTSRRSSPAQASSAMRTRSSYDAWVTPALWGGCAAGTSSTRSRRNCSAAARAIARCASWMGSRCPRTGPVSLADAPASGRGRRNLRSGSACVAGFLHSFPPRHSRRSARFSHGLRVPRWCARWRSS